jgi:hypothetical protein
VLVLLAKKDGRLCGALTADGVWSPVEEDVLRKDGSHEPNELTAGTGAGVAGAAATAGAVDCGSWAAAVAVAAAVGMAVLLSSEASEDSDARCSDVIIECSCCSLGDCFMSKMHWMRSAASPSVSDATNGAICHPRPGQRNGFMVCISYTRTQPPHRAAFAWSARRSQGGAEHTTTTTEPQETHKPQPAFKLDSFS